MTFCPRIHKAEKTQMQREADQGTVLQSVTIPIGELRGAGWGGETAASSAASQWA